MAGIRAEPVARPELEWGESHGHRRLNEFSNRRPTRALDCLRSLGKRGVNPRHMHNSFTLELPTASVKRVHETLAGDVRRPCVAVSKVYLPSGAGAGAGAEASHGVGGTSFDRVALSEDGLAVRDVPNAGGASVRSEVMSVEILKRAFGARLLATEMQAWYWPPNSPITDYVCTLDGETVGVSVTRAFHYAGNERFTEREAQRLVRKKLQGVLNSTSAVVYPEFKRQVLHVFCKSARVAELVLQEYRRVRADLRANTVLFLTVCEAEWVYTERLFIPKKTPLPKNGSKAPPEKKKRSGHRTLHHRQRRAAKRFAYQMNALMQSARLVVALLLLAVLLLGCIAAAVMWMAWSCAGAVVQTGVPYAAACAHTLRQDDT